MISQFITNFISVDLNMITEIKILILLGSAAILGTILSLVYQFTHRKMPYDRSFAVILIMLPTIIAFIIMLVSDANSVPMAFSLAGVFTLVRFRTVIADPKDITYILSTVAVGLALALGLVGYAILLTIVVTIILLTIYFVKFSRDYMTYHKLNISIPENLNYVNVFDDLFDQYLKRYKLQRVKTSDFGTIFQLTYLVIFKDVNQQKEFIDAVRVRNGNLMISITNDYASMSETVL